MTPSPTIDAWEARLRNDHRLNKHALRIAHVLGERFNANNGCCQLSNEGIADAAGIIALDACRRAVASLERCGWIYAEHIQSTRRKGLLYRPAVPADAVSS
jgi:hypothetical protein